MAYLKLIPRTDTIDKFIEWFDNNSDFTVDEVVNGELLFIVTDETEADLLEMAVNEELNQNTFFENYRFEFEN